MLNSTPSPYSLFAIEGVVWGGVWDVNPDGETFVINRTVHDSRRDSIRVVLGWPALIAEQQQEEPRK